MSSSFMHGHQYAWLTSIFTGNPVIIALAFLLGAFPNMGKFLRADQDNKWDGLYGTLHQIKWYFFYFFIHTVPDKLLWHDLVNGGWRWFTFHAEVIYWIVFMLVQGEALLLEYFGIKMLPEYYVIGLYIASFVHDLEKLMAVQKYEWKNIKAKFHHGAPHYWEIRTFSIWLVPLPFLALYFWSWTPMIGLIGFWIEDLLYYTYRLLVYRVPFPPLLSHLEEIKIWFLHLRLPKFMKPLTLQKFAYTVTIQIILLAVLWSL